MQAGMRMEVNKMGRSRESESRASGVWGQAGINRGVVITQACAQAFKTQASLLLSA